MSGHVKPTAEQIARTLWDHDVAEGTTPEWREMAWNDMGGSEKSEERVDYELRAESVLAVLPGKTEAEIRADECEQAATNLEAMLGDVGPGNRNTGYGQIALDLCRLLRARAAAHRQEAGR